MKKQNILFKKWTLTEIVYVFFSGLFPWVKNLNPNGELYVPPYK